MMKNIWQTLPRPFFVQAPMEDVTDSVFRQILAYVGAPDLYFSEFTHADGIVHGNSSYIEQRLQFTKKELPIIGQIWGNNTENYIKASEILKKRGYDGIDINMGCPVKDVVKNGCCSALINNPLLAGKLFEAAKKGGDGLPVSIKTRIGFSKITTEEWIGYLLSLKPAAITIHARTTKEMSLVPAHFDEFGKAVLLRNKISPETLIVANGDIISQEQGSKIAKDYGVDGIMIGRGMLHNPWVFSKKNEDITVSKRLKLLKKHAALYEKTWGKEKNFEIMKKFCKAYVNGFQNASEMRQSLMQCKNSKEFTKRIDILLKELPTA